MRSKAVRSSGDIGGGSLETLRPWLGAQWLGPTLGVPSCAEPPGAPRGGAGAELGRCRGALRRRRSRARALLSRWRHFALAKLRHHAVPNVLETMGVRSDKPLSCGDTADDGGIGVGALQ